MYLAVPRARGDAGASNHHTLCEFGDNRIEQSFALDSTGRRDGLEKFAHLSRTVRTKKKTGGGAQKIISTTRVRTTSKKNDFAPYHGTCKHVKKMRELHVVFVTTY